MIYIIWANDYPYYETTDEDMAFRKYKEAIFSGYHVHATVEFEGARE